MSEPILVRFIQPMRGAPESALLPADVARRLIAEGAACDPRDRFGASLTPGPQPEPVEGPGFVTKPATPSAAFKPPKNKRG